MRRNGELVWESVCVLVSRVHRSDGRALVCSTTLEGPGGRWIATAVELASDVASVQDALDAHAHADFGAFASIERAQRKCATYARAWQRRADPLPACACPPIALAPLETDAAPRAV